MGILGPEGKMWRNELAREWQTLAEANTDVNPEFTEPLCCDNNTTIYLIATDTISAAIAEHKRNPNARICILNFASYQHPGGGFITDMFAQEEAICYCSDLFPNLAKQIQWYNSHQDTKNHGAYTDECLVSHDITVIADAPGHLLPHESRFKIDVITCAAPNWISFLRYSPDNKELYNLLLDAAFNRVLYLMKILSMYNYDTIILGAFGCGVFRNNPGFIADAFRYSLEELLPKVFNKVIFAIPDSSSENYRAFYDCFSDILAENSKTSIF